MEQVFCGQVYCHCHWARLETLVPPYDNLDELSWKGQRNGLVGTAVPEHMSFTFGLHTGRVNLRIVRASVRPGLEAKWEEVVESPFRVDQTVELAVKDFNGDLYGSPITFQPGDYRARFCALNYGYEVDHARPTNSDGEYEGEPLEHYELVIWPATRSPDEVVRVTSDRAVYWHKCRREENGIAGP